MRILLVIISLFVIIKISAAQDIFVDKRTNVKILFSSDSSTFPKSWKTAKINAQGFFLSPSEHERSKKIILNALSKYPAKVLKENLKTIYVLQKIEFYGQQFGGTNSTTIVYVSNNGIKNGYTDIYLEQLFHSEFSSILFRNYKESFNKREWTKNNKYFTYGNSGVNAMKKDQDSQHFDDFYNQKGLLYQYAMSTIENDFNSFTKYLFVPKNGFKKLLKKYNNLKNKRELVIEFYHKIDPSFTKNYFDNL